MDIFRTKLYYFDKNFEDTKANMLADVEDIIKSDIDNEDIVMVTKSEDENYVREISTGVLIPIIDGDKLVYRNQYVNDRDYFGRTIKVLKTSVPAHIITFRDNLCKSSYGVPSLDLYCDKVSYPSMVSYLEKYKDRDERYHYLCRQLYFKDNQDDFTLEDSQEYRKKFNSMLRKRYSIFSGDVFCPYPSKETFSIVASFLEGDQSLPLEVPIDSFDDFGVFLFQQLKLRDFSINDTMVEKLLVTLNKDNKLKEIRTKEEIPYVYYQLNEEEKKAKLMVNGRPASFDEAISYFTFMPLSKEEVHTVSKADIREYRKYYTNFDAVLHSYTECNQVGEGKSTLRKPIASPVIEVEVEQEKVNDSSISPVTFTDSSFSNQLLQVLEIRNKILSMNISSNDKKQLLENLNQIISEYDSSIESVQKDVFRDYAQANIQNRLLEQLTKLESTVLFSTNNNYDWIPNYLKFIDLDSKDSFDKVKQFYDFSLQFQSKIMTNPNFLLQSLKVQEQIDEYIFQSLLKLNPVELNSMVLLFDDNTVSRLSTVVDNHIDVITDVDGDKVTVLELKRYNAEKALKVDKDSQYLRDYMVRSITSYSQLSSVRSYRRERI